MTGPPERTDEENLRNGVTKVPVFPQKYCWSRIDSPRQGCILSKVTLRRDLFASAFSTFQGFVAFWPSRKRANPGKGILFSEADSSPIIRWFFARATAPEGSKKRSLEAIKAVVLAIIFSTKM